MQTTWTLAWTSRFLDWLIRCLAAAVQAKWCIQCSCVCVCVCRCVTVLWTVDLFTYYLYECGLLLC